LFSELLVGCGNGTRGIKIGRLHRIHRIAWAGKWLFY
jgi:hypothetical protein